MNPHFEPPLNGTRIAITAIICASVLMLFYIGTQADSERDKEKEITNRMAITNGTEMRRTQ